jgi:hypothetical protein
MNNTSDTSAITHNIPPALGKVLNMIKSPLGTFAAKNDIFSIVKKLREIELEQDMFRFFYLTPRSIMQRSDLTPSCKMQRRYLTPRCM